NPKHGYGKNLNPCIDCRILMLKNAKKLMEEKGASFLITGEVLGQRPRSQYLAALKIIEREGGLDGLVLRPLSAKLLPLSVPEKEGWVNREKLLEISGRSRKPQIDLADKYGIRDYPCPAGGCLLTDRGFAQRMKDLMTHSEITLNDVELLKTGRYFRLSLQTKLVVGRNKKENERLLRLANTDDICFEPVEVKGPIGIGRGDFDQTMISLASKIMARYSDGNDEVRIAYQKLPGKETGSARAKPMKDMELQKLRI
ncbi:tRNA 4-thiouridine(8) synthase ThiI, partial [Candidatus Aerophobetes bacterium]